MIWKALDFQRIATFDHSLVNHLIDFLSQKETRTASQIMNSVNPLVGESFAPVLPLTDKIYLKIEDALDAFAKKIRQISVDPKKGITDRGMQVVIDDINAACWSYLEVLESSETELFEQLGRIGITQWNVGLYHVVEEIKELLVNRLEDLNWSLKRLDKLLREYRGHAESRKSFGTVKKWMTWLHPVIDRSLFKDLKKTQSNLTKKFNDFDKKFKTFNQVEQKIHILLQAIPSYLILSRLSHEKEEFFARFSRLLILWENNSVNKQLPEKEINQAIKNAISPERALSFFNEYYSQLKEAVYEVSRNLKGNATEEIELSQRKHSQELLLFYRVEVNVLSSAIMKYRDFLLKTNANAKRKSDEESGITKELLNLAYKVDELNKLYDDLHQSTENKALSHHKFSATPEYEQIQHALHEMSQPLTTQKLMSSHSQKLVEGLSKCDELGSSDDHTIYYVGDVLSKALRADWKYQVLSENPHFHKLYEIHLGVTGPIEDRSYQNRKAKFERLLDAIKEKVHGEDVSTHLHDIEHDMNDVRAYLQDFLAYVQRICGQENPKPHELKLIKHQLLEYRYLFSNFFYQLSLGHQYQHQLRNQFLFVDQYFESIENLLNSTLARTLNAAKQKQATDSQEELEE